MLVGYVSDERYVALADVAVEFEREGRSLAVVRSSPRGAIDAPIEPGRYRVTLSHPGHGSKSLELEVRPTPPYQFRLLSNRLLGYIWPKWSTSGDYAEFKVHAVAPYRLSLWRYGQTKEFIRPLGWFDEHGPLATMQITPDGDYSQVGVAWNRVGYGSPHMSQLAQAPERSGLYYFHAETDSGDFFSFPWVVAPRQPSAQIAVLASTNTWNAYNNFGGRSNYVNAAGLPPTPTVNARLDLLRYRQGSGFSEWGFTDDIYRPLSFERPEPFNHVPAAVQPTDPLEGRQACHLAPAEWRLLAWLERENFAYDFYSDQQLHAGRLDLDAYKTLIISVHPEYWSAEMVRRVTTWVHERGGRLLYLGGNGLNCEAEFLDENRLRFKTHLKPARDGDLGMPDPADPSRYFESRLHRSTGRSEANLLGVVCTDSGIMTAAPYQVLEAGHWAFAGTGLAAGDLFGRESLHERIPGGASGHETDKVSASSPAGTLRLAKGTNPDGGGADMTYYETASGGAVFGVGSITYVASVLVDPVVSRITTNVLGRFLA